MRRDSIPLPADHVLSLLSQSLNPSLLLFIRLSLFLNLPLLLPDDLDEDRDDVHGVYSLAEVSVDQRGGGVRIQDVELVGADLVRPCVIAEEDIP